MLTNYFHLFPELNLLFELHDSTLTRIGHWVTVVTKYIYKKQWKQTFKGDLLYTNLTCNRVG